MFSDLPGDKQVQGHRARSALRVAVWNLLFAFGATILASYSAAAAEPKLQFNRDVRPILSDTCFKCHGFDKNSREADLRLDQRGEAVHVRDDGTTPIVPGHPEQSEAYRRLISTDADDQMPPPSSHLQLTAEQKATIKQWIAEGATYQPHWAFIPPAEVSPPDVKNSNWARNPIDQFILGRLESAGLAPSPEADRRTLIRRLTLDLNGLPPTPEEVEAFVEDSSPDAYELLVDRLLASPHYGERMVAEWLDAARYADSNGYQGDPTRTMWPWRDWVIRAMNDNLPFDEFLIEQLAGDLLPDASLQQKLASAFNRNHAYNGEGGRIPEETRVENVLDRVDTAATTFLGLTVGCSKCHDHKYDPLSQREYYQLFAYFNQSSETGDLPRRTEETDRAGGNILPVLRVPDEKQQKRLATLRGNLDEAIAAREAALPEIDREQVAWEEEGEFDPHWTPIVPVEIASRSNSVMTIKDDASVLVGGATPESDVHELVFPAIKGPITSLRLEALVDPSLPHGGPGRSEDSGNFVLSKIEVVIQPRERKPRNIPFLYADATYSQPTTSASQSITGNDGDHGWAVWHAPDPTNLAAMFCFSEPIVLEDGETLRASLYYESENSQHSMGRFRLSTAPQRYLTQPIRAILAKAPADRSADDRRNLTDFYRLNVSSTYKGLEKTVGDARAAFEKFESTLPSVMVMNDAQPRETHVLVRGVYNNYGELVEPGVPAALHPFGADLPRNRLGLARWLTDPTNPLTARVIVNRYWQSFFGTGIVKTTDDFGTQGELPVHPDLLDFLARRFVASGWDVKAMHRLIVTSATYRQRSHITPELLEHDPDNRLLARGPRFRLSSLALRDSALAASGLLVDKLGGPPARPYQPAGVWEEMSLGKIRYRPDTGSGLYRRSIYTFWRRTVAPTTLFDVSPRSVCVVRAQRTNTPLQALTLLNDTTYVEAARVLAETVLAEKTAPTEERIDRMYMHLLARPAHVAEQTILQTELVRLHARYANELEDAKKLIAVGQRPADGSLDVAELAAWTVLANLVMNTDEVLNKE